MGPVNVLRGARSAPPFCVSVPAVVSAASVSVVRIQVGRVVPTHRMNDTDEAHRVDLDYKDEHTHTFSQNLDFENFATIDRS